MMPNGDGGEKSQPSTNIRSFCSQCGTHLWAHDDSYAHWIYPFASAIDTELPTPTHTVHMMLGSKAEWVPVEKKDGDKTFDEYPELGIEEWHKKNGCYID